MSEQKAGICGGSERQVQFWKVRNIKAALGALLTDEAKPIAMQTAIAHIMRSLTDIEAVLASECHAHRCNSCGLMVWDSNTIQIFGARFCMDCGTELIEAEAEDEGLREGLAADLARQALNGRFPSGLHDACEDSHPHHDKWVRIVRAAPEIGQEWLTLRKRLT